MKERPKTRFETAAGQLDVLLEDEAHVRLRVEAEAT